MARGYLRQVLVAADQLMNAFLGGWADESLSSRAYRTGARWAVAAVNALFLDRDHCRQAYYSERTGRQLPPELRP